uniref:Uncharacterized protein n=1 Tax=Erpetoichthys calabaricus TaxID=27687 RepID=A0A8C4TLZ8_ERPCA
RVSLGRLSPFLTKSLQPWLVGLIAVVGFLFLVFTLMILNRLFYQTLTVNIKNKRQQKKHNSDVLATAIFKYRLRYS